MRYAAPVSLDAARLAEFPIAGITPDLHVSSHKGSACLLCPPGHPRYELQSVYTAAGDDPMDARGQRNHMMVLLQPGTKSVYRLVEHDGADALWVPLPADHPEVAEWRLHVLGYFRNCYRSPHHPEPECWHAGNLAISERDPIAHAEDHAGVHLIRRYYPAYVPRAEEFANAYWGEKPTQEEA